MIICFYCVLLIGWSKGKPRSRRKIVVTSVLLVFFKDMSTPDCFLKVAIIRNFIVYEEL